MHASKQWLWACLSYKNMSYILHKLTFGLPYPPIKEIDWGCFRVSLSIYKDSWLGFLFVYWSMWGNFLNNLNSHHTQYTNSRVHFNWEVGWDQDNNGIKFLWHKFSSVNNISRQALHTLVIWVLQNQKMKIQLWTC